MAKYNANAEETLPARPDPRAMLGYFHGGKGLEALTCVPEAFGKSRVRQILHEATLRPPTELAEF